MPSAAFKAPPSAGTAQRLMSSAAKRPATLYTGSALYVYPHIIRTEGIIGAPPPCLFSPSSKYVCGRIRIQSSVPCKFCTMI